MPCRGDNRRISHCGPAFAGAVAGAVAAAAAQGKEKQPKTEFSKIVLLLVMATYFVGLIVGIRIVLLDTGQLSALLLYIGGPTTTAIAFYSWKAKAENLLKIQKENPEAPIDFNNITGG